MPDTLSDLPGALAATIASEMRRTGLPGLAIAAFDTDGIVFAGSAGLADIARDEPVTLGTRFRAASVSKLFTALVTLRLVDAGRFGLDTDINTLLDAEHQISGTDGGPAHVAVRDLLSHSSGMAAGARGVELDSSLLSLITNGRSSASLNAATTGLQLAREPGARVVYANNGYNLLGYLAAECAGESFEFTARDRVLAPLGMHDSVFAPLLQGPGVATTYGAMLQFSAGTRPARRLRLVATPMAGLYTTVLDLARFGRMLLNRGVMHPHADSARTGPRRFVSSELLDEAFRIQARNHPALDEGYGLGFISRHWRGRRLVGHDGNMPGVSARIVVLPDDDVGVCVLANGGALPAVYRIVDRALAQMLDLEPEVEPGSPQGVPPDRAAEWQELTDRAVGRWRVLDYAPSRMLELPMRLGVPIRVAHAGAGRLELTSRIFVGEPAWLLPDGEPGRYRLAFPIGAGTRAVLENRPTSNDLWWGTLHFRKGLSGTDQ